MIRPMSREIFQYPVKIVDHVRHMFERKDIEKWVKEHNSTNPMTTAEVKSKTLIPDDDMKAAVEAFRLKESGYPPSQPLRHSVDDDIQKINSSSPFHTVCYGFHSIISSLVFDLYF
jgi:hypothetical protein